MNQLQKYVSIANRMEKATYPAIARIAGVSRQAVALALKGAGIDLRKRRMIEKEKQAEEFVRAARKLNRPTPELRPREIAQLTGFPYSRDTKKILEDAGVPFCRPTPGSGKLARETPRSKLAKYAKTLPATAHLTAKEIAHRAGLGWHKNPANTLRRHNIPFRLVALGRYAERVDTPTGEV